MTNCGGDRKPVGCPRTVVDPRGPDPDAEDTVKVAGAPRGPPTPRRTGTDPSGGRARGGAAEAPRPPAGRGGQDLPPLGPDGAPPEEPRDADAAALVAGVDDEVLVVDELPRYHLAGCRSLIGIPVIPLPAREAVELGFTPCGWCTPDRMLSVRHRAPGQVRYGAGPRPTAGPAPEPGGAAALPW